METFNATLSQLVLSKLNARSMLDQHAIEALAADMKASGVMAPLIVRSMGPEGAEPTAGVVGFKYEVICGSRRFKAAELAELPHVPVHLMKLTDKEALGRIVHENRDREDFHYLDLAESWRRWREAGKTAEEIAEEMKVSRSTVLNTIAMVEKLTPEAKRACFEVDAEKQLPESVAKELATVPAKLQGQALKKCQEPTTEGRKRTARESIELIRSQFRLDLKKAPFDPGDPALKAEACGGSASCDSCPYRTGNAPELFEEQRNPNLCTNPPGFRARADADWARQVDDGEHNRGPKCLPDSKAEKLFTPAGTLRDDADFVRALDPCHQDKNQRAYKTLLGKAPEKYIVLARIPVTRDVVQLLPLTKLQETLDEIGLIRRRLNEVGKVAAPAAGETEKTAEEKKLERERIERRFKATQLIVGEAINKLAKRGPDKKSLRLAADRLVEDGALEHIWARRGVTEAPSKYLDRLSEADLFGFVLEGLLESALYPETPKYTETTLELAKMTGVDVKEHERTVTAAERVQPSVKKADEPKTAETPAPKPAAKKVTPKKKGARKS
jgi:ParB/RepB/Spo0J family partition protein